MQSVGLQVRARRSLRAIQKDTSSSRLLHPCIYSPSPRLSPRSYNELILDAAFWTPHLPQVVEAVFFPATSVPGEAQARRVRASFQEAFNYPAHLPPLVRMNLEEGTNGNLMAPFELVED
jgi:hypothetical protein